jgi:glycosyltransferase involved in cell wall biosynthesis
VSPRVVHVSPTYFAPESALGGGERFAEELARAMAARAEVKLVSFGPRAFRESPRPGYERPGYERVILESWTRDRMTPFAPGLLGELRGADVVHCHQFYVLPTFLAALFGRLRGARIFVSDLGGGGWTPAYQIDQTRWIAAHLPISEYAARALPGRNQRHRVIHGGVDLERHPMRPEPIHDGSVVFLGRVLPHKGVHFLIEGLPPEVPLHVVGPTPDAAYLERLETLAAGKDVRFHGALPDSEVIERLGRPMALVHPTPVDAAGSAGAHELFGLALVEAMARGCPVIASDAASLPEIVTPEANGLLVPPNQPEAIGAAIHRLAGDPELWRRLSRGARRTVEEKFTWDRVVDRCLAAYGEAWG